MSDTLFGDLAPRAAANAMYNAISSARRTLSALGNGTGEILLANRASVYISPSARLEVDLELHEQALARALRMSPGHARDAALAEVLSVAGVLLEDDLYTEWSLRRRESLEMERQEARLSLARDRSSGFGRSGAKGVIEAWEAAFSHDPASEEAATCLITVYAAEGQRQLAARAYSRCRAALANLGLEPSGALEQTFESIANEVNGSEPTGTTAAAQAGVQPPGLAEHLYRPGT